MNNDLVDLSYKNKFEEWFSKNQVLFEPRKIPMCNSHGVCQDCDIAKFGAYCYAKGSSYNEIMQSGTWQELILSHSGWIYVMRCILKDEKKRLFMKK